MRIFCGLWEGLARFRLAWRFLVKTGLFIIVLFFVMNPHPALFFKQLYRYMDMESLIQTDFPALETINREINAMLPPDADQQHEFEAVQKYVYQHIEYAYDWDNWGNVDFWPTAEQVWERQEEDCDGQAVLAATILRSRGFPSATLVGNIQHIWVHLDQQELMGPMAERNISNQDGRLVVKLPSLEVILGSMAIYIADFPTFRNLLLLFVILLLCYHPHTNLVQFLGIMSVGLIGFIFLKDWAYDIMRRQAQGVTLSLIWGTLLLGLSLCASLLFHMNVMRKIMGVSFRRSREKKQRTYEP